MREILFRGKCNEPCKYNGQWIEGFYGEDDGKPIIAHSTDRGLIGYFCEPDSIGQYTGLTDKNGKKIFEGDIVKTKFGRICKVIFFQSPCYCGIDLIPLEDKHKCPDEFDLYLSDNLEIIGNIHDNPELLEVEK